MAVRISPSTLSIVRPRPAWDAAPYDREGTTVKILKEFKDFLMQGNLITLAIAFVLGTAFAALLAEFVKDIITPIIGMIVGKTDFSNLTFSINSSRFFYGSFINAVITFVTIAAAVFFFIVKPYELIVARRKAGFEEEPVVTDEERRHQELLEAIRGISRQPSS
jgi:large conductance mechanosensitive channel